tara:strand:+ start:191 stop:367 length:177 start_codon:yes stop_codon:yes gene_type:complete
MQDESLRNLVTEDLESLLICMGSYLFNNGELYKIDTSYLLDLKSLLDTEIEKREIIIH